MAENRKKTSILSRLRNYFFAGAVVLIPIGITLYLSLFIIKVSTKLLPKELNPNYYLNFEIPGVEIIIAMHCTVIVYINHHAIVCVSMRLEHSTRSTSTHC